MTEPMYLGDGVYASVDEYRGLVLTTGHHEPEKADDIIILEPDVLDNLMTYVASSLGSQ